MITFGTKAETLHRLQPLVRACQVPELRYFTASDWEQDAAGVCARLRAAFGAAPLAIRSSALSEDGRCQSLAGAFRSVLRVEGGSESAVRTAVQQVLNSYVSPNPRNQVLVQAMLSDVMISGVAMTHDLTTGAPYFVINYDDESGQTDAVTGGRSVNKTLYVHHDTPAAYLRSPRVAALLGLIRELQSLTGGFVPLDIEFALTADGCWHLLQVRRIAVQKNWNRAVRARLAETLDCLSEYWAEHSLPRPELAGETTLLGQMPDWNPAELIGTHPSPLAVSLFRRLISDDIWQAARAGLGYRGVPGEGLLVLLAGRPYVDVRASFNSFLPAGLPAATENQLVNAWLSRLSQHPELHDKVEFEVAQTVMDFTFATSHRQRYPGVLSDSAYADYAARLRALTAHNVTPDPGGSLAQALRTVRGLETGPHPALPAWPPLRRALHLLEQTRTLGSYPFCIIARHAFMAEALLRSAVVRQAWSADRLEAFKTSLDTVARQLGRAFAQVMSGQLERADFLRQYGHLRPGTFDLRSLRYDQRDDLFRAAGPAAPAPPPPPPFVLTADERTALAELLAEIQLPVSPEALLEYSRLAIAGRENAKFLFSRYLSEALEALAEWGENLGLARDDLAHLTLADLAETLSAPATHSREAYFHDLAETRRAQVRELNGLRLGFLIRDISDLYVVPLQRGAANFVTTRTIEAEAVRLDQRSMEQADLYRKIVCIESADPGYDWVFVKGIAGLVTQYGGANSHMTIRCAELGLPAAIGVGEQTFEHLAAAGRIELRCGEKVARPIYG